VRWLLQVFSDAPDNTPSGGAVLANMLADDLPCRFPFIPPPYDPHDNPSLATLLRALPINISRCQTLLDHAAEKVEQELFNNNFLSALKQANLQVKKYGLPVDLKAAQAHFRYLQWRSEVKQDNWLLAYAPFIRTNGSEDSMDPNPYKYSMFLMKGPGYAQDTDEMAIK